MGAGGSATRCGAAQDRRASSPRLARSAGMRCGALCAARAPPSLPTANTDGTRARAGGLPQAAPTMGSDAVAPVHGATRPDDVPPGIPYKGMQGYVPPPAPTTFPLKQIDSFFKGEPHQHESSPVLLLSVPRSFRRNVVPRTRKRHMGRLRFSRVTRSLGAQLLVPDRVPRRLRALHDVRLHPVPVSTHAGSLLPPVPLTFRGAGMCEAHHHHLHQHHD